MKKLKILIILSCISLIAIPTALGGTGPLVYVATDGSGDYNCDGINDHIQIQQALDYVDTQGGGTVYLKSGTYTIDWTIEIGDNTELTGSPDAIVTIPNNAGWGENVPLIADKGSRSDGITISGFQIDGNRDNQPEPTGYGYYRLIYLSDTTNIVIHDMNMWGSSSDDIKCEFLNNDVNAKNVEIYGNTIYRSGHDCIYILRMRNIAVYDNTLTTRTNSGIRLYNSAYADIYDNYVTQYGGGQAGVQIQHYASGSAISTDIDIHDNEIDSTYTYGIKLSGKGEYSIDAASDVHIYNNIIYDTGISSGSGAGIQVAGFDNTIIENNVIDGPYVNGVVHSYSYSYTKSYTTIVRNNIISNVQVGYGIHNVLDTTHSFILENNCIYNSAASAYTGGAIAQTGDVYVNPMFVDRANHDYRLRSDSPIYGAGIGLYDGTDSTPETPSTPEPSNTAPVLDSIGSKTVDEGSTLNFILSASDADGDSLTYSATDLPSGASIDSSTGAFSWIPSEGQAGTYSVMFEVTDGELTDSDTVLVTVRDTPSDTGNVNLDIVSGTATIDGDLTDWQYAAGTTISGVSDNTATVKAMYDDTYLYISYDVTDSNLQADGLTETSGLHLDDSVEIYLDTLHNAGAAMQADDYHFIINLNGAVVDDVGTGTGKDYSYTSNILNSVNLQGTKNDASADTGYIVEVAIPWSDIGGQPSSDVSGLFLAVNDQDNTGTVYVLNWCDLTSSYAVPDLWGDATIAATSNTAPVMTPIDDRVVDEGNTVSFTVSASDAEDNLLTYSVSGLPSGASFDATSGVFSWTPSDVPTGDYGLVFEVTDGELTDSEAMIITVNAVNNDPLVNNLPVITAFSPANDAVFEQGTMVNIGVTASDADGQELNYLLKIDGDFVSTTSSYVWKADTLGTYTIETVVSDGTDQVTAQHVVTIIKFHPRWDVNKDGVVNILDVTTVAQNLGSAKPHRSWDVNEDGEVNIQDLTIVAHYFGETIPM